MEHLAELNFLIDRAKAVAGSDYKVAQALGVTRMNVSNWRHGKTPCSPEHQTQLAALAGFDPVTTLVRAVVEKHEGTALGDRLMRVLGKTLRATGAALGFVGASALAIYSMSPTPASAKAVDQARGDAMCIMSNNCRIFDRDALPRRVR